MLAIKSVDNQAELNILRLTEEVSVADYLYILKYSKQMLHVSQTGEVMLGTGVDTVTDAEVNQAVTDILNELKGDS